MRAADRRDRWWTLVAPVYDRAVALVGWHRRQEALVADATAGRVLDVGCGPAHLARILVGRGVAYVGVDRNAAMASRAARRVRSSLGSGVTIVRADVTALPFRDESFDVVVAAGLLGLLDLPSRRVALREMARVGRREVSLLEPVHRAREPARSRRSRLIGLVRDRPIEVSELVEAGLDPEVRGRPCLAKVYSTVRAIKRGPGPDLREAARRP